MELNVSILLGKTGMLSASVEHLERNLGWFHIEWLSVMPILEHERYDALGCDTVALVCDVYDNGEISWQQSVWRHALDLDIDLYEAIFCNLKRWFAKEKYSDSSFDIRHFRNRLNSKADKRMTHCLASWRHDSATWLMKRDETLFLDLTRWLATHLMKLILTHCLGTYALFHDLKIVYHFGMFIVKDEVPVKSKQLTKSKNQFLRLASY